MAKSTGQNSRNTTKRKAVNTSGKGSAAEAGAVSDGEEIGGAGVAFNTVLNERTNKSLNRNAGPERPMANKGYLANPGMGSRKTGKVG